MTYIRVVNQSRLITNADVRKAVAAIQIQITRDFAPDWHRDAKIGTRKRSAQDWVIVLADTIDVNGALGYHTDNLIPSGIVDVALCQKYGLNWTVTLSHEVLEMLGDPTCDLVRPYGGARHVAYEACDPVESDQFGYLINGVQVSDFVLQAWFNGGVGPYDFTNTLKAPLTLAPGGYVAVEDANGHWTQVFAKQADGTLSARAGFAKRRPIKVREEYGKK